MFFVLEEKFKMPTIFSKIIKKEIPAHILIEDDKHISFLDINPLVIGHTLVVPKKEIDYIFDMDNDDLAILMFFAKKVAHGIQTAIPCLRIAVSVIGIEVPHAHIHLIPLNTMDDVNFSLPKLTLNQEEFANTAAKIKEALH